MTTKQTHCDRCGGYSCHLVHTSNDMVCPDCLAPIIHEMAPEEGLSGTEFRVIAICAAAAVFAAFCLGVFVGWAVR